MEKEMAEVFDRKVKEKQKKMNDTENELRLKLKEAQEKLDKQREELEEKMELFEKVIIIFSHFFSLRCAQLPSRSYSSNLTFSTTWLSGVVASLLRIKLHPFVL